MDRYLLEIAAELGVTARSAVGDCRHGRQLQSPLRLANLHLRQRIGQPVFTDPSATLPLCCREARSTK
jgi:hypothetical protein